MALIFVIVMVIAAGMIAIPLFCISSAINSFNAEQRDTMMEIRKLRQVYTLFMRKYHPSIFQSKADPKIPLENPIEMTPERFKELPYRQRMTATEAAIHYEKSNEERLRKEAK